MLCSTLTSSALHSGLHKPLPPLPEYTTRNNKGRPRYKNNLSSSSSSGNLPLLPHSDASGYLEDQSFSSMATADEWGRKAFSPPSVSPTDRFSTINEPLMGSPVSYDPPSALPFRDIVKFQDRVQAFRNDRRKQPQSPNILSGIANPFESGDPSLPTTASELTDILALIEDMKKEPEWLATRYHLLAKNCNSFTNELCYRLTGRQAPAFINRAAWLAQSLPCLGETV